MQSLLLKFASQMFTEWSFTKKKNKQTNKKKHSKLSYLFLKHCHFHEGIKACYGRGLQLSGHGLVPICGLLGSRLHRRRWAASKRVKPHLYLQPLPNTCMTTWALPPVRSVVAVDSYRSMKPAMNCTCEASRLLASYENLNTWWSEMELRQWG